MRYDDFKAIFNNRIWTNSKHDLIKKIANNPSRYIGLFRPTKPSIKILQNLSQSHEIRFGDAFEEMIGKYLTELGFTMLEKSIGQQLVLDQHFKNDDTVYLIEQKIRDDHDSTKKRGQINNFRKKLEIVLEQNGENGKKVVAIMYFADPGLSKNKNYYREEIDHMTNEHNADIHLFYGGDLFKFFAKPDIWDEILNHLSQWKKELPDFPETNFDLDSKSSFEEIKDVPASCYKKIFGDDEIFEEIILTIFPQKRHSTSC